MPQDYRIKSLKRGDQWESSYGSFQSYALSLEGIGEPVQLNKKVPVNKEPSVGDLIYGNLELKTSKAGKTYYKFKAERKPDAPAQGTKPTEEYWEDKNKSIRAQWAIGQAVNIATTMNTTEAYKNIETEAKGLFKMVDRVSKETDGEYPKDVDLHPDAQTPINDLKDDDINLDDIPF